MKKSLWVLSFCICAYSSFAQYDLKKQLQLNLGVGMTNFGAMEYLGADYGLHRDITIGLAFHHRSATETYTKLKIAGGQFTVNYHLNHLFKFEEEKCDMYIGPYFDYWLAAPDYKQLKPDSASIGYGVQFGVRHYFSQHLGFLFELQGGALKNKAYLVHDPSISGALKLGLTYRF